MYFYMDNVTSRAGPFRPQGHYFNNFGRNPLADAPYKISKLWGLWLQRKRFLNISLCISIEIMWPLGRGHFCPHIYYLNNFGRDPLDDAPCKISELWSLWFQWRRFLNISLCISIELMSPLGRGHFWPHIHYLNILGRDLLDDAPCKISELWGLWFQRRRFFNISLCITIEIMWPLERGQYWPQDQDVNKLGRGPLYNVAYQIRKLQAKWSWRRRFSYTTPVEQLTPGLSQY